MANNNSLIERILITTYKMKTLIIVVCVVVANVQAAEFLREMIGNTITECKEEVNATPDDIVQLLKHSPTTTTPAKCFVACINKKLKIQNAAGEIDAKATKETLKLAKYISEDMYQKAVGITDICLAQIHQGDNECDVAYSFFTCALNEATAANIPSIIQDLL